MSLFGNAHVCEILLFDGARLYLVLHIPYAQHVVGIRRRVGIRVISRLQFLFGISVPRCGVGRERVKEMGTAFLDRRFGVSLRHVVELPGEPQDIVLVVVETISTLKVLCDGVESCICGFPHEKG